METEQPVITPTIGRRVLYFSAGTAGVNNPQVPFDCGIAYVWSDSMINVGGVDHNGGHVAQTSVRLLDRTQTADDAHGSESYAVWMPYQFEQAQRAAERERSAAA